MQLAQDQSLQEGPGARVLPSGRCLWAQLPSGRCLWARLPSGRCLWAGTTCHQLPSASCVHQCLTHAEAKTRPSNLQARRPPRGRGRGLFPQVHNQSAPLRPHTAFWKLSPPTSEVQELQCSKSLCLQDPSFPSRLSSERMFFLSLAAT